MDTTTGNSNPVFFMTMMIFFKAAVTSNRDTGCTGTLNTLLVDYCKTKIKFEEELEI